MKLDRFKTRTESLGPTSSAKFKQILKDENLYRYSSNFNSEICRVVSDFKKMHSVDKFHSMKNIKYPLVTCPKSSVQKNITCSRESIRELKKNLTTTNSTHDFVTACIAALTHRKRVVNLVNGQEIPVVLTSFPGIFRQDIPSFLNRTPDLPFYSRDDRCYDSYSSIKWLVEVKRRSQGEFNDDQIGQILDMTFSLLRHHQHEERVGIISCLTDGYRFKFFLVTRVSCSMDFIVEHSAMFEGDSGWQVRSQLEFIFEHQILFYFVPLSFRL